MGSFESLVECNKVSDERRPGVVAINTHTLTHILDGKARVRSRYFIKRNIFENAKEVVGPYLEGGNHWTFFHCNIVDRSITYLNSLGEQDKQYYKIAQNWSTFAAAKGYQGPWKRSRRSHTLQDDSISCGVFTAVFAETFLRGDEGNIACPPIQGERERLGLLLLSSLDRSGICGICHKMASKKNKEKCSTCSARIHAKCLSGSQEDKCLVCKGQNNGGSSSRYLTGIQGEDSTGKSNRDNTGIQGEDNTGKSNRDNTGIQGEDNTGESNRDNTGIQGEDSTGQSNRDNTGIQGEDSTGQSNRDNTGIQGEDNTGEINRDNPGIQGEDSTGQSNRDNSGIQGEDNTGKSNRDNTGIQGEDNTGHNQEDQTRGFLVESVLKVSDFHQAKRYLVTADELRRRCSLPESYSSNTVVAYLRKAKGQKRNIEEKLAELEVKPSKRTKLTSQCSKLCEDECNDLAGDIMYLAAKFIPQKRVGQALMEDGNVHAAMAKTEDCRKTLKAVKNALETNWETFDLATHGLGPAVIKGTFALIDACLNEKMRVLKSKVSTDE
ncbi:uncharacterized protein LOC118804846 isoform X3 [Colossoma macropomum]|uniref:uncharacterized protein LOC118804846 isoform X3 n=1 Tax=Colossoma macropomum TaxID=42526 RepID=UPI0018654052|nr:uncharacterized protein LOC118804846 isoform X3 [Colossoma macropomum]